MTNISLESGRIYSKTKTFCSDYVYLLFKSAAENHLRKQSCVKNPDGTYVCTISFKSYSALKRYQEKVRRVTVSLTTAIMMAVVTFFLGYVS